jgi:hypothetical protein
MSTPYRAAYWISPDRQSTARLTGPNHADLPNYELLVLARAEARANEMDLDGAHIIIEQPPSKGA